MLQTSDHYTVNRDTLSIRVVNESDQDQYWCKGQRDGRPQSSHFSSAVDLTVKVRPKPVVKVTPDQRVFRGETVTLTCDIQGGGNIQWTYSWFKDGSVIRHVTERVYTITSVSDSGEYSCRGERSDSQRSDISAAVTLTVSDLPTSTLTVTPDSPVFTGETVNLKCVIESYSNWRYEWYKGSTKVSEHHTVNRDTFTIRGVKKSDAGQPKGQRDGKPNSSQSERPKPVVKVTPDQRVFRGETVTLTCDIQGGGNIQWTYSWFKDGSVIRHVTERVYTITSVSDSGEYSCRGERSDSQRSDISAAVTLTVSDLPTSTLTVTPDSPVFTGETVNLKCVIKSDHSNWRYEWYKGNTNNPVMLQTSDHYIVNGDTLSIVNTITSDQDQYWCKGQRDGRPQSSHFSSAVYLTVK
ncbi:basement membrane-specific heparan sulfate proteoglycan core protein-like, partial [Labeo rohita]|uniref:basement membrane-specific heparan sulfate proteoglycan core protein-like n=1 Tax=Labeo rohita TaxID=84645 RepID=UPI0021E1DD3A